MSGRSIAPSEARADRLWHAGAIAVATIVFAELLVYPLGSDVSVFQWMTLRLVKDGALPYVGSWDHNFPGVMIFHAVAILLFGNSEVGFRAIEAVVQIATSLLLYRLVSARSNSASAGFFAVLLYATSSTHLTTQYMGQRDTFAAALMIWSLWPWFKQERQSTVPWILSGCGFAIVILIRPLYLILPLALVVIQWREHRRREVVVSSVSAAGLLLLSVVPFVITGAWHDYYESTVLFNLALYGGQSVPFYYFFSRTAQFFPVLIGIAAFAFTRGRTVQRKSDALMWFAFLGTALFTILLQAKYLPYHYAPLVAAASPVAGIGVDRLLRRLSGAARTLAMSGAVAALAVFYAPTIGVLEYLTASYKYGAIDPDAFDRLLLIGPETGKAAEDSVLAYVTTRDVDRRPIEVASYDGRLRMRFTLPMASRFTMMHGLNAKTANGTHPDFQERWRKEYVQAIDSAWAPFVVLSSGVGYWKLGEPRYALRQDYPQLYDLLHSRYRLVQRFGTFEVYERIP